VELVSTQVIIHTEKRIFIACFYTEIISFCFFVEKERLLQGLDKLGFEVKGFLLTVKDFSPIPQSEQTHLQKSSYKTLRQKKYCFAQFWNFV